MPSPWWTDFVSGVSGNAGTYAAPKLMPADWNTLGAAGDEYRVKATHASATSLGAATWTNASRSVVFADVSDVAQYDMLSIDLVSWYPVLSYDAPSKTATLDTNEFFAGSTGSATTYRLRPVDLTGKTSANMTWAMISGTASARVSISGGWDSETTQNGYTCYRLGAVNAMSFGASLHYATISKFFVCYGNNAISMQATTNIAVSDCDFARQTTGSISNGGSYQWALTGCRFHGCAGTSAINVNSGRRGAVRLNVFRLTNNSAIVAENDCIVENNTIIQCVNLTGIMQLQNAASVGTRFRNNTITRLGAQTLTQLVTGLVSCRAYIDDCTVPAWASVGACSLSTAGWRALIKSYNRIPGDDRSIIGGVGSIIRNVGDSNITLPGGYTDCAEILFNLLSGAYIGSKAITGLSIYTCPGAFRVQPLECWFPIYSDIRIRLYVSTTQALSATEFWIEAEDSDSNHTIYRSTTSVAARSGVSDWSQYVEIPPITTHAAAGVIRTMAYYCKYHASNKVYVARLCYSVDGGTTWIDTDQVWEDGEITWRMPANGPVESTVQTPVKFGRFRESTGSLPLPRRRRYHNPSQAPLCRRGIN